MDAPPRELVERFYDAAWSYRHAADPSRYKAELDDAGTTLGRVLGRTFYPVSAPSWERVADEKEETRADV